MASFIPARMVIRAPNWLGDLVMALPAMAMARRAYPEAELTIAAPPAFAPVFEQETGVGTVEVIAPEAIRSGRFDTIMLMTNSFGSAWRAKRAGIDERWGFAGAARSWLLTRAIRRPRGRVHQVDYYLALTRGLGLANGDELPRIRPNARATELASAVEIDTRIAGHRIVGFAPGAAYGHAKRWPPKYAAEVIAALATAHGIGCVLVGTSGDVDAGREIESALGSRPLAPGRLVNLIGRTDLRLLIGLLARCEAFVTNDSGSMHLAAALGTPVVAMFGPTDERVTAPRAEAADVLRADVFCRPCMLRDCPIDHRCMKRIAPERALAAVVSRLS
ncbi:MAG TPA: lipopolysaccharide heptosyltransferase II [Vicinamibacterales bacterium]|nr:lipopolysaccharide heptosyltransferase II [Vicinamibacterales bacterium]